MIVMTIAVTPSLKAAIRATVSDLEPLSVILGDFILADPLRFLFSTTILHGSAYGRDDFELPQDRQGARPHCAAVRAHPRRRGDRIATPFAAVHESAFGPKRTSIAAPHMSAFRGKANMSIWA